MDLVISIFFCLVNNATVNIHVQGFMWTYVFISVVCIFVSGTVMAGSYGDSNFLTYLTPFYNPTSSVWEFIFFIASPAVFVGERCYLSVVLSCMSLIVVKHLLMYLHWGNVIQFLCPSYNCYLFFYCWACKTSLCILNISPFSYIMICKNFLQISGWFFTLWYSL